MTHITVDDNKKRITPLNAVLTSTETGHQKLSLLRATCGNTHTNRRTEIKKTTMTHITVDDNKKRITPLNAVLTSTETGHQKLSLLRATCGNTHNDPGTLSVQIGDLQFDGAICPLFTA